MRVRLAIALMMKDLPTLVAYIHHAKRPLSCSNSDDRDGFVTRKTMEPRQVITN